MRRALALASRSTGRTSPNPLVGAVVVGDGAVIGEGTTVPGAAHAEVAALARCGGAARGATLYVTLEPCAHHGRTPPCVDAVIASGVSRVVAATGDPDPRVDGRGFAALRAAGIAVDEGVLRDEAEHQHEAFLMRVREGRPFVSLKLAATLDGRVAVPDRRYLSDPAALRFVHRLRARADAVMVGIGTVLADDPMLTVREVPGSDPLRVILDTHARTPPSSNVVRRTDPERTVILVGAAADPARIEALTAAGASVVPVPPAPDGHIDLAAGLRCVAARGVNSVLAEGGPGIATALLRLGLVDRVLMILAPLLGGPGPRAFGDLGTVRTIEHVALRRIGADVMLSADLVRAR